MKASAVVLSHRPAVRAQPLIATVSTNVCAISTHWASTGPFRLAGFSRAPILRLGRAVRAIVPACFA
eukprot:2829893-Pyramimonas_sp.AAC.1